VALSELRFGVAVALAVFGVWEMKELCDALIAWLKELWQAIVDAVVIWLE